MMTIGVHAFWDLDPHACKLLVYIDETISVHVSHAAMHQHPIPSKA